MPENTNPKFISAIYTVWLTSQRSHPILDKIERALKSAAQCESTLTAMCFIHNEIPDFNPTFRVVDTEKEEVELLINRQPTGITIREGFHNYVLIEYTEDTSLALVVHQYDPDL